MKLRIILIGFGVVGQGLARILLDKKQWLKSNYGFEFEVVAVSARSKGAIASENGLDIERLLSLVKENKKLDEYPDGIAGMNPLETIDKVQADILVEVSYTNLSDGEPATSHCIRALEQNLHVVTANKGPIALHYSDLKQFADSKKLNLGFEGTVMSGTPVNSYNVFNLSSLLTNFHLLFSDYSSIFCITYF